MNEEFQPRRRLKCYGCGRTRLTTHTAHGPKCNDCLVYGCPECGSGEQHTAACVNGVWKAVELPRFRHEERMAA